MDEWLLSKLITAYHEARRGKRKTDEVHKFELNAPENLINLRDDILARRYKPGKGKAFISRRPVTREVFVSLFRDRIVQHLLYDLNNGWWERRLNYRSAATRKGKGVLFLVKELSGQVRSVSDNYRQKAYVIKMDIQGYFMSLPREKLYERICWGLDRQYPERGAEYELCKYLWREIVFDDPVDGVRRVGRESDWNRLLRSLFRQKEGVGLVIGSLASQMMSNMYLDLLDRYVTLELGYRHYGRYVDDFYIVVTENELPKAKDDIERIRVFLESLGLTLHPKKTKICEIHQGVEFLGTVLYPGRIQPGKRLKTNFKKAAARYVAGQENKEVLFSYIGLLMNCKHNRLIMDTFAHLGVKLPNLYGKSAKAITVLIEEEVERKNGTKK